MYIDNERLEIELKKFSESYVEEVYLRIKNHNIKLTRDDVEILCKYKDDLPNKLKEKLDKIKKMKLIEESLKQCNGEMSEELGSMFLKIAYNLINKRNFINYTYRDEMIGKGIIFLCKYAKKFDYKNPKANGFAYVTQICRNGFIQCIKDEAKHSVVKDTIIKRGMEHSISETYTANEKEKLYSGGSF